MSVINWLIIIGAPLIIGLVILETVVARKRNMKLYTLSDSITNLSCGILERVFDVFFSVLVLFGFNYIHEHVAPFPIELNIFTWIIGLFVADFIAYWFHRLSHEINFLWAAHIVHHQSEELNLTTVFRVSFLAVIYRACFFFWMALAGFDVFTIVTTSVFLGFYQLFTHSRVIGKLGIIEKFMTTPSHHRVHHARNEKYMDQNYGHIFIIWDRMFGSFVEEEEEPDYGITTGYERADPFDAVFSYWKNLFTRAGRTKRFVNKIKTFVKGPEYTPEDVPHLPDNYKTDANGNRLPHRIPINNENTAYILLSVLITAIAFVSLLALKSKLGSEVTLSELATNKQVISIVLIILFSVFAHARFIENKSFLLLTEGTRLILIISLTIFGFLDSPIAFWLIPLVASYCVIMFAWLLKLIVFSKNTLAKS